MKLPRKKSVLMAGLWIVILFLAAVASPYLIQESSRAMNFSTLLEPPSSTHLLGTDALGRDLLARILVGSRVSLGVAFIAVLIALILGVLFGSVAGYFGGWLDRVLMGFVDLMLCFPSFFLILAVIALLGPNIVNIMIIIGATSWMGSARLVRAEVLALKEREFILASKALGASHGWILRKHLVPNAMGPVIVSGILGLSSAILVESGLSFLGIGVQPPTPSWGNILMDGKSTLGVGWWMTLFPGLAIFLTTLAVNTLGEELHRHIKQGQSA